MDEFVLMRAIEMLSDDELRPAEKGTIYMNPKTFKDAIGNWQVQEQENGTHFGVPLVCNPMIEENKWYMFSSSGKLLARGLVKEPPDETS